METINSILFSLPQEHLPKLRHKKKTVKNKNIKNFAEETKKADESFKKQKEKDLAQTELATKDAKKALDEYALQGPTLLSVKAQDLEYSRRFMDKLLRRSNTRQKRIFDSWFKNRD